MVPKLVSYFNRKLEPGEFLRGGRIRGGRSQTGNDDRVLPCLPAGIDDEHLSFLSLRGVEGAQRGFRARWRLQRQLIGGDSRIIRSVDIKTERLVREHCEIERLVAERVGGDQGMHWEDARGNGLFITRNANEVLVADHREQECEGWHGKSGLQDPGEPAARRRSCIGFGLHNGTRSQNFTRGAEEICSGAQLKSAFGAGKVVIFKGVALVRGDFAQQVLLASLRLKSVVVIHRRGFHFSKVVADRADSFPVPLYKS